MPTSERFFAIARIDARALDAEEDEHRDQHGRADLVEQAGRRHAFAAPEVGAEQIGLNAKIRMTMNTRIGTILAIVTTMLMTAACWTPRRIMK